MLKWKDIKKGDLLYHKRYECYLLIVATDEDFKYGRSSIIKNPSFIQAIVELNGSIKEDEGFKIREDIIIGYNNIYNLVKKYLTEKDYEDLELIDTLTEDIVEEFNKKEIVFEQKNGIKFESCEE